MGTRLVRCLFFIGFTALLAACGNSSTTQSGATCSATGTANGSSLTIAVSCSGGTAPYSVASIAVNGQTPTSLTGETSFTASTSLVFTSASITSYDGLSGAVYITDAASSVATAYSFTVGGTSTTSTYCSLTPSTSVPAAGATVTFTAAVTSAWGSGSYTFSSFSPGSYGTTTTALYAVSTTQAYAAASYSTAGTSVATVYVTDTAGTQHSCSTTLSVSGTSTSSGTLSCVLASSSNPVAVGYGTTLTATITGSTGSAFIQTLEYPIASGMAGYFTGSTTAYVGFNAAGSWTVRALVRDSNGGAGSCSLVQTVY